MTKVSACPITVAMAAPFTPILNAKTTSSDCVSKNWTYAHRCSFMWRIESAIFPLFYQIFNFDVIKGRNDCNGFDIVIGNPPYGAKISETDKELFKTLYSDVHMRTPESFCYFSSLAFRLVQQSGIVSFIVPNNLFFQNENENTRNLLMYSNKLLRAINLGDGTFENGVILKSCGWASLK